MDRLSALDATFLHFERKPGAHMHFGSIVVVKGELPPFQEIVDGTYRGVEILRRYRQKLLKVPFRQGRPIWVDDPGFDPRNHLDVIEAPAPADDAVLLRLAQEYMSEPIDRSQPLWASRFVTGLSGGRYALLAKLHHALVDGVGAVEQAQAWFEFLPNSYEKPGPAAPLRIAAAPRPGRLLVASWRDRAAEVGGAFGEAGRTLIRKPAEFRRSLKLIGGVLTDLRNQPKFKAAKSPYNSDGGPGRKLAYVSIPLPDFKEAGRLLGGTINDLALAAVAATVRKDYQRRGLPIPATDFRAMVPVNLRGEHSMEGMGNEVVNVFINLPIDEEDPLEQLRRVRDAMDTLKHDEKPRGMALMSRMTSLLPAFMFNRLAEVAVTSTDSFNIAVTNIPGPPIPMYMHGNPVTELVPMLPIGPRRAITVAIVSYVDTLTFGLSGDDQVMAELDAFRDDLKTALYTLMEAAGVVTEVGEEPSVESSAEESPAPVA